MTKAILGALAVLALLFPVGAAAQTTIIEPLRSHLPYQRWIDESAVPTPDVTVEVFESERGDGCPPEQKAIEACSVVAEGKIWIAATQLAGFNPRETFMHEIGHFFDAVRMTDWDRERFEAIYGLGGPWLAPGSGAMTAGEWFAEAYAECAVKPYVSLQEWIALGSGPIYGSRPIFGMRIAHNRACRLIQSV